MLKPKRIIHNRLATIVFWNDDTKTVVKCSENDEPDNYTAFCAAYCKKVFGNNSHLKRVIKDAENGKLEKHMVSKFSNQYYLSNPMPGCQGCEAVSSCPDCITINAIFCIAYHACL